MRRISLGLWLAVAGAVASFVSLGTDFYVVNPSSKSPNIVDAWIGLPHASDLVFASALVTTVMVILVASNRAPARGSLVGGAVALVGAIGLGQLLYRIALPPFGGCLSYGDCTSSKATVTILFGMWLAVAGCAAALVGGLLHVRSSAARETVPHWWATPDQAGSTPLLGLSGVAAVVMFASGFTLLPFYTNGFSSGPAKDWSAWIATPKTADLVLLLAAGVVFLVVSASRRRAPLSPGALGGAIVVAGLVCGVRILYRILDGPFISSSHEPGTTFAGSATSTAEVHVWAFIALAAAVVVVLCGIGQALNFRQETGADARVAGRPSASPVSN